MATTRSDALVLFGATGDLAYRKIFPALYSMVRRGQLTEPIIGVALEDWDVEKLAQRAREGITKALGGVDEADFARLASLLRYVSGDYRDQGTFDRLRTAVERRGVRSTISRCRRACSSPWSRALNSQRAPGARA